MAISRRATKQQRKLISSSTNSEDKNICFTIMPFGGWFDHYYSAIYVPPIEKAGLTARRADDLYRPSTITNDIWTYTQRAKLILADLSGKNPNVFYELGLAHALAKPAIMITESMEDTTSLPFGEAIEDSYSFGRTKSSFGIKTRNGPLAQSGGESERPQSAKYTCRIRFPNYGSYEFYYVSVGPRNAGSRDYPRA